jgi:hypothetical protein
MRMTIDSRLRVGGAATLLALAISAGCRRDAPVPDEAPPPAAAPQPAATVALTAPQEVGWNEDVPVRVTVHNDTGAELDGVRLRLFLSFPLDPSGAPEGAPPPSPLAASGEGVELEYTLGPIPANGRITLAQAVRTPPAGLEAGSAEYDGRRHFLVRARLVDRAGAPLGEAAVDTLRIRAGAEAVVGGCATADDVTVSSHGIGPVRLGMTAQALRALCPEARDSTWRQEGTAERGLRVRLAGEPVLAVLARDTVRRVVVTTPGVRTAAGVGVGATLDEMRGRYGRACAATVEGVVVAWFPNAPGIRFALDAEPPVETAAGVPDDARVTSLWVRAGTDECPAAPGERDDR